MEFSEDDHSRVAGFYDKNVPWERALGASVAILIVRGSTLSVHGSGTLFRLGTESFVITAAHVINQANASNLCILPADSKGPSAILPLEGETALADDDKIDVAAMRLKASTAEKIEPRRCLRLDDVSFDDDIDAALFTVFGFPTMLSYDEKSILRVTKFFHLAAMPEKRPTSLRCFDPRHNFLIDADGDETRGLDGKVVDFVYRGGVRARFPKDLGGISGGSVWKIADGPNDHHRGSEPARLVGVETCVYSNPPCIQATRWRYVLSLIASAFRDLQPAIDLLRPVP